MNVNLQHWRLDVDAQGIATATLDKAGESANSLSGEVMREFSSLLDQLDVYPPKGLIIRSGKEAGFIAGADIGEFSQLDTPEKSRAVSVMLFVTPAGSPLNSIHRPSSSRRRGKSARFRTSPFAAHACRVAHAR